MNTLEMVFGMVLDTTWRASCLILLWLGGRYFLRSRVAPHLLFWVWLAVALRLLLPISVPTLWSPFNLVSPRAAADARNAESLPAAQPLGSASFAVAGTSALSRTRAFSSIRALSVGQWAALGWCAGAMVLGLARVFACGGFARRLRRSATAVPGGWLPPDVLSTLERRGIDVRVSEAVAGPALVGVFQPRIIFPPDFLEKLSSAEIRLIVAHELAHAERRDLLADAVLHLAAIVHWFNPLVWWATRIAREDCEFACDERVMRRESETGRAGYGAALLRVARLTHAVPRADFGLGVVASRQEIKRRLQMILAPRRFTPSGTLLGVVVIVGLTGSSFTREIAAQAAPAATSVAAPGLAPATADVAAIIYNPDIDRLDHLFPTGVVGVVDDRTITVADVRSYIAPLIPSLRREARTQEELNGRLTLLQNSAIKDLVDRALLIRQFRDRREGEQPRQIDPNQVDQEIVSVIQDRFGGDRSQFLEYLRGRNLTLRAYRQEVEETIIYRYMRAQERKVAGRSGAPAAEPAEKPIHLRIIQLTRSAGETDAALLERANVVLTRFRAGESFAQLARKFDQFVRQTRGGGTRPMRDGDWGWQGPSDLRPQFRDAVMALQKGEVSAPLVLPEGCFLIYAEDRR